MRIGVYGSASEDTPLSTNQFAKEVGREIARGGHILVTGGCPGFPNKASVGAYEEGGHTIAYSPATSIDDHVKRFSFPTEGIREFIFISTSFEHKDDNYVCLKYRNIFSVASVDAGIIIGGRTGTMNEFTLLYDWGKNIGILDGSGGITKRSIKVLLEDIDKNRGSKIIYDSAPKSLVER